MIKCEGPMVMIKGTTGTVLAEGAMIIKNLKELLTSEYGEELAFQMIQDIGKLAFMDKEERRKMAEEAAEELIKDLTEGK